MSRLAANLHRMNNTEINALARNPYVDPAIQLRIAKEHHLKAREYLACNPNLISEAREVLWSGKSHVVKCCLVAHNHCHDEPDKIREVYEAKSPQYWRNAQWRMQWTFLGSHWRTYGAYKTPADVLNAIYDNHICHNAPMPMSPYSKPHAAMAMARQETIDTGLAIKMSVHQEEEKIRKAGFDALIMLKRQEK